MLDVHKACLFDHILSPDFSDYEVSLEETLAYSSGTSLWSRYISVHWFTFSILIGSERGDIAPVQSSEMIFTIAIQVRVARMRMRVVWWRYCSEIGAANTCSDHVERDASEAQEADQLASCLTN